MGEIGGVSYTGDSCVIDPNGEISATANSEEKLICAELDYDIENLRSNFPVRKDRQVSLYKSIGAVASWKKSDLRHPLWSFAQCGTLSAGNSRVPPRAAVWRVRKLAPSERELSQSC